MPLFDLMELGLVLLGVGLTAFALTQVRSLRKWNTELTVVGVLLTIPGGAITYLSYVRVN